MSDLSSYEGKAALVTGAADGIGMALAEALVGAGARVFGTDIAAEKLADQAKRVGMAAAPCDVSDEKATGELVERAWDEIGPIDVLCANAGVIVPGSLLEASREDAEFIFGVNVWGVVHTCRPFVRRMREAGRGGRILLTGSEHSLSYPGYLRSVPLHLYNMTKHAVLSIGEALRAELGREGVDVSVLCPGPVVSGLTGNSGQFRPTRFGGPHEVDIGDMDPEEAAKIAALYMPAAEAARIALRGLAAGAFVIPTHGFQKEDVEARYQEAVAGFDLLSD